MNVVQGRVVSRDEWLSAREAHLESEKSLFKLRDQLAAERRTLPWVKVDKPYAFDGPTGKESLSDLFEGRGQLIVQHFMFGPDWTEGCVGCSFQADHVDGALLHLENHDVSFVAVSRAPLSKIAEFKQRLGWQFNWVSSFDSDFNTDFQVSYTQDDIEKENNWIYNYRENGPRTDEEEASGISVFIKDEDGTIYHTYSSYGRGTELLIGAYNYLDLTPNGRNEGPGANLMTWVHHHDKY